jgi:hypothetical protein
MVGKPETKRAIGVPRQKWVNNIKMDLGEREWGDVDWIGQAQDRDKWRALVNAMSTIAHSMEFVFAYMDCLQSIT